ncbi:putative autophagy-related 3 protein atg3, partial [Toxoplasma gondii MAS]
VGHDVEGGWMLPLLNDEEREGGSSGEAPDLTQSMQNLRLNAECGHELRKPAPPTPTQTSASTASNQENSLRDDVPDLINFADIDCLVQEVRV